MNILVLGNGFDLAHGLKTSYRNFLDAVKITDNLLSSEQPLSTEMWKTYDKSKLPYKLVERLNQIKDDTKSVGEELKTFYIGWKCNFWFKYFAEKEGTWIDFEKHISSVCHYIEKAIYKDGELRNIEEKIDITIELSLIHKFFNDKDEVVTFQKLIIKLEKDLKQLINSFDIYIYKFINKQECKNISPDIISLEIDKVICFNYSETYKNVYNIRNNVVFDYIHGKAGMKRNNDYSNLVLGFAEVSKDLHEDRLPLFAPFKKYYQRVLKETDNEYVKWVENIKSDKQIMHSITFFGHSMDVTDKDILRALLLNENVVTTIYYYCYSDKMQKLKSLVAVLGYDEFLWYTKNSNIKFKLQEDFNNILYSEEYWSKNAVKSFYNLPYITKTAYEKVNEWFGKVILHPYKYKIKYIYMAIDALEKHQLERDRSEELKKNLDKFCETLYSYENFNNDYPNYCGKDTNYKNESLCNLINSKYKKQMEKRNSNYERLFTTIQCDKKTMKSIMKENGVISVSYCKLNIITNCFLSSFDKNHGYDELYTDMTKFLLTVDLDLVNRIFSERLNDSTVINVYRNRIQVLKNKFDMLRRNENNRKNIHYRKL